MDIMGKVKRLKSVNAKDYLTIEEAATELGIKPPVLRNYLHSEKMTTYKFKTLTLLSRTEVEAWQKRQRER